MGEEKLTSRNSLSDSDLATAGRKPSKSGFPPGITVDELWLYRRKRPSANSWPRNNLELGQGSFKSLKTEYKRRFKNYYDFGSFQNLQLKDISPVRTSKPVDSLKVEGIQEFQSLYNENFIEYPIEKALAFKPEKSSIEIIDPNENETEEVPSELLTEFRSKYVKYPYTERPRLPKRATNLKLEGDLYTTTEQAEKFIEYLLTRRRDLMRTPTTLKLEGDMDVKTENREKFIPFEIQPKPPLCKKFTNLHLEGDLYIITEKQAQYQAYEPQKRPPLTKKNTNLRIEGEIDLLPEYKKEFIEYKAERPKLALPVNNLKTDGFYDAVPDVSTPFQQQIHPQIPFLRETEAQHEDYNLKAKISGKKRDTSLKLEGPMEITTENKTQFVEKPMTKNERLKAINNLYLEGRIDLNPEYRNAYIDHNKEGHMVVPKRTKTVPNNLKTEGKMEINPEYSRSYVNFPRKRPQVKRPECSLSSEGELDHMTEKKEKYVPFPHASRTGLLKREPELKLEGEFECQPEYRKAYIDYLIRERVERKPRPLDNLGTTPNKRIIEDEPVVKTSLVNVPIIQESSDTQSQVSPLVKSEQNKNSKSGKARSLSQIESSVFGPKLTVPGTKTPSRSSSPTPSVRSKSRTKSRNRNLSPRHFVQSSTDSEISSPRYKKFGNPIRVENLAHRSTTPVLPLVNVSAKNRWMKDSSVESSSAFVVLDKDVDPDYVFGERNRDVGKRRTKYVPSWYSSHP